MSIGAFMIILAVVHGRGGDRQKARRPMRVLMPRAGVFET